MGGFVERGLADKFLNDISNDWAPEAFLSRYNDKYYVVHSMHKSRTEANAAKASINEKGNRAWISKHRPAEHLVTTSSIAKENSLIL